MENNFPWPSETDFVHHIQSWINTAKYIGEDKK